MARKRKKNQAPDLDTNQERLLDELLLVAENQGEFYPDRPDASVDKAIRSIKRSKESELREDLSAIRALAIKELRRRWRESMRSNNPGPTGATTRESDLVKALKF